MIDQNKIIPIKVAKRLGSPDIFPHPSPPSIGINGFTELDSRIYEIDNTDDYGKAYFTEHHLKQSLWTINYYIRKFEPPEITPMRDARSTFNNMSQFVIDDLDFRALPALKGLDYFTIPPNLPSKKYKEICSEYNKKVQVIKTRFPNGKGRYKQSCDQLSPEFQKLLSDLKEFFEDALKDYFNYIPD